jgi:hypothetical protein
MTTPTDKQIRCLHHALGLGSKPYEYRNYYCTSPTDPDICALVDAGLMAWFTAAGTTETQHYSGVTEAGRTVAWAHMPVKKAYACYDEHGDFAGIAHAETPSKARYRTYRELAEFDYGTKLTDIRVLRCKEADRRDPYEAARELGLAE